MRDREVVGSKVKSLTPDTTIAEIASWIEQEEPRPSIHWTAEWIMAMEDESVASRLNALTCSRRPLLAES